MLSKKLSSLMLAAVCAVGTTATNATAQTWDKKVYFTFSGPVEIPGATLPAGKYMFHLTDPDWSRQVLQVQSAEGKVYSMFFSQPVQRNEAPDEAEVRFMETASGAPPAISTLWYPGERTGRELIYPRAQALRIAQATRQPVLTTKSNSAKADETKSGELERISASGESAQIAANNAPAEPTGRLERGSIDSPQSETPVARSSTPVGTAGQTTPARRRLPDTASHVPFLLVMSFGFFAGSVALRLVRNG